MEDAAAFLVDTSDNMILSHRSSALVGSTLESAASDPLMQSVAEKLDALSFHATYEDCETATKTMNDWLDSIMPYKSMMQ